MAKAPSTIISHWFNTIENFQASPMQFYSSVEDAIKRRKIPFSGTERVKWHESGAFSAEREYLRIIRKDHIFDICGAPYGTGFFVSWWFGERKHLNFVASVAVFGFLLLSFAIALSILFYLSTEILGTFFGSFLTILGAPFLIWLFGTIISAKGGMLEDSVLAIPLVGFLYSRLFNPVTYYKIDTAMMFQQAVHAAVLEVLDELTKAKGIRALSEFERKPILREFYQKQIA